MELYCEAEEQTIAARENQQREKLLTTVIPGVVLGFSAT